MTFPLPSETLFPTPSADAAQRLYERIEREVRQNITLRFSWEEEKVLVAALRLQAQQLQQEQEAQP